jgi:hypothetical protein
VDEALEEADWSAVEQALAVALEFEGKALDDEEDAPEEFEVQAAADWIIGSMASRSDSLR